MTVRQHLAEEIAEFLPEMLNSTIQQANIEHRKKQLEKMTQMTSEDLAASVDRQDSETDVEESDVEESNVEDNGNSASEG